MRYGSGSEQQFQFDFVAEGDAVEAGSRDLRLEFAGILEFPSIHA